jgi:co-chaperonin GroES (HSP10)
MLKAICFVNVGGKMHFEPKNRHVLVLPIEEKQSDTTIILPDDYKAPQNPYVVCDVLDLSGDCTLGLHVGDTVVVERRMLQEIKAMGDTNYLVLENYVYGRLYDE